MGKKKRGIAGKSKIRLCFLILLILAAIFNIFLSLRIIAGTYGWIFNYIARPMFIFLLVVSIISLVIAIIYCFVKKRIIIVVFAFVCMVVCASLVFSSFSLARPQPESMKIFLELTDVKNIDILNFSDLTKEVAEEEIRVCVFGKNAFEVSYTTPYGRLSESDNYTISQEIYSSDNMFFVNHQKLITRLTNYYIKNDIWDMGITDDDIHTFAKGDVKCSYVYISKPNEYSSKYDLAYYSFVIYTDEKVYASSYRLMCTNPFEFDSEKTTERIADELISKDCL